MTPGDILVVNVDGRDRAIVVVSVHHGTVLARIKDTDTYIVVH